MVQPTTTNIYGYGPSVPAAAIFLALYTLTAVCHCYLCTYAIFNRPNKHRYTIPAFIAAILFSAGYGVRIASTQDTGSIPLYAVSSSLIVISSIFICATLYLLIARLIVQCLPEQHQVFLRVSPKWIGRIFVSSDIVSFLTQASGSGIASSGNWTGSLKTVGIDVLLLGLVLQVATFSFFLVLAWRFVSRVRAVPDSGFNPSVKQVLRGVWVAGALVEVRSIYRTIEFALGINGYPFSHEWMLYVFEAVTMLFALSVLEWYHPVRWLQRKSTLASDLGVENAQEMT